MTHDPIPLIAEAQEVLDDLWQKRLIPIELTARKITKESSEYTIHFFDSRIRTARIPLTPGSSFREMVRSAVLARVTEMSGPLKNWKS